MGKFIYATYGQTMVLNDDVSEAEYTEIQKRFTKALAASMSNTKEQLVASMLGEQIEKKRYEKEVDFGQE